MVAAEDGQKSYVVGNDDDDDGNDDGDDDDMVCDVTSARRQTLRHTILDRPRNDVFQYVYTRSTFYHPIHLQITMQISCYNF